MHVKTLARNAMVRQDFIVRPDTKFVRPIFPQECAVGFACLKGKQNGNGGNRRTTKSSARQLFSRLSLPCRSVGLFSSAK